MIQINGSKGGGQILRTALTMSALKQKPFKITKIRGSRTNPGLKKQHLKAVQTIKNLTNAETTGVKPNSQKITFKPKTLKQKKLEINIGTAGSTTLLLDTIIPLAHKINLQTTVKGGTDVKWSPTYDYFKHVKLPLLQKFGLKADTNLEKTGYYPKGRGKTILNIKKSEIKPIEIHERGKLQKIQIYSKASKQLQKRQVADRQANETARILKNSKINAPINKNISYADTKSPGSTLLIKAIYENSIAGFDNLGERGKTSEKVAKQAVQKFKKFHATKTCVDQNMADQLMVFGGITKGKFSTPKITNHIDSNQQVMNLFEANIQIDTKTEYPRIRFN